MGQIKYRNALEKDIPDIFSFEAKYMMEIEPDNYQRWLHAKEKNYTLLQDNLQNMIVAENDGEIFGHSYWSVINNKPYIFSVYVCPTHRDKGAARTLISKIEEKIVASNFNMCFLSTHQNNPAKIFFTKIGYEVYD